MAPIGIVLKPKRRKSALAIGYVVCSVNPLEVRSFGMEHIPRFLLAPCGRRSALAPICNWSAPDSGFVRGLNNQFQQDQTSGRTRRAKPTGNMAPGRSPVSGVCGSLGVGCFRDGSGYQQPNHLLKGHPLLSRNYPNWPFQDGVKHRRSEQVGLNLF